MADNTILPGTGETYAAIDRGDAKHQRILVEMDDSDSIDAAGRLRTSSVKIIFDSKLIYLDKQPLFWDESLESGAGITSSTPTATKPYIDITSTLNTAGKFTRQTFNRFNYQSSDGLLFEITDVLNLSGGGTGVERRVGPFDDDNGLFFEDNAGVVGVTNRSNDTGTPTDITIAQTAWNIDKMSPTVDGVPEAGNPSGITVDWTKVQIFVFDFTWLSVGRIRCGLKIDGKIRYVHKINTANLSNIPWASTSNFPIRHQIITTANSPASAMRVICSSVGHEGSGMEPHALTHSHATVAHVNAGTADAVYALVAVRLKSTHVGTSIQFTRMSAIAETNDHYEWQLIHNATVAGTFNFTDKTNSSVQIATGDSVGNPSANTVTGGTILSRGFATGDMDKTIDLDRMLTLGVAIDGITLDTFTLAVRPLGPNADIQGALVWREL